MTEVFSSVTGFITEYYDVVFALIGVFALIATKTPNKADDKIIQALLDIINFAGANVGKAANKDEE
jgi:hypothetical protein